MKIEGEVLATFDPHWDALVGLTAVAVPGMLVIAISGALGRMHRDTAAGIVALGLLMLALLWGLARGRLLFTATEIWRGRGGWRHVAERSRLDRVVVDREGYRLLDRQGDDLLVMRGGLGGRSGRELAEIGRRLGFAVELPRSWEHATTLRERLAASRDELRRAPAAKRATVGVGAVAAIAFVAVVLARFPYRTHGVEAARVVAGLAVLLAVMVGAPGLVRRLRAK